MKLALQHARAAVETNPSPAQIEAGNYAKGHVRLHGLDVTVENPKGSVRRGVDRHGNQWETRMAWDYGYFRGTEGKDGEHVDVFVGPNPESELVYVVDQVGEGSRFDEHKVVMGATSEEEARDVYLANYKPGWTGLGNITALTMAEFKEWLANHDTTRPMATNKKPPRLVFFKATQLGLFDQPRKPVQQPGVRGGHWYRTDAGEIRYGERPEPITTVRVAPAAPAQAARTLAMAFTRLPVESQDKIICHLGLSRDQWQGLSAEMQGRQLQATLEERPKPEATPETSKEAPEVLDPMDEQWKPAIVKQLRDDGMMSVTLPDQPDVHLSVRMGGDSLRMPSTVDMSVRGVQPPNGGTVLHRYPLPDSGLQAEVVQTDKGYEFWLVDPEKGVYLPRIRIHPTEAAAVADAEECAAPKKPMVSTLPPPPPRPIPDNLPGMAVAGLSQEFRHYGDPGDPVQGWQVSEEDYVAEQARRHVKRAETNALGWKRTIEEAKRKVTKKERERAEWNLRYWTEEAARVKTEDPNPANLERWRSEYLVGVKKAISTGKPVPYAVIKQRKEFRTAQDARARYEKGVHTSFGNESIAVNRGMKKARGYKVKRQDGKPINAAQLKEIETGFDEIESVLGPVKDILDWCDITIAHTNGKHPFLKNAGGLYRSGDRTISMGVADHSGGSIASLAHELAHFLDFEAGRVLGKETKFWGHSYSRRTPILSTSLAEAETRYGSDNVLNRARYNINNVREVERTMKLQQVLQPTEKDKVYVERTKVSLGPYWREPCEIFARLVEQYIRTQIGHGGASIEENYGSMPGWWTDAEFAKLAPQVREEVDRRLKILRDAIASGMAPPKVLSKSFIGGIRLVLGNLFAKSEQLALFGHPVHYHTGEPRKPVQAPGSRGARYWIDDHGTVRYDERPKAPVPIQTELLLKPPAAVATTAAAIAISKAPDPKRAEKLRALADGMQGTIDQKRDPGVSHQNVTRRRSEMAAGMAMDADRIEGIQSVLYALADLHDAGTVPPVLENVTSRVQVEELLASRWHNGKVVIGPETYPRPMLRAHDVTDMLRLARHLRIPGAREITYRTNDEYVEIDTPAQWEAIGAVARKVLQAKRDGKVKDKVSLPDSPGGWEWAHSLIWGAQRVSEASAAIKRVDALNLTPEQWGRAQAEIRKLRKEIVRGRDVQVREMERKLIGVKIPGYFPTPKGIVEQMVELAEIKPGMTVLEPSAGKGNIADVIAEQHPNAQLDVIEYAQGLREILSFKGHHLIAQDFIADYVNDPGWNSSYKSPIRYDRIIQNPPFENGQDVDHIRGAYKVLKPGGRLVSIMGAHAFFAGDQKSKDFREWLDSVGGTEQKLPEKSFMSSERPTGVNTHLVVIDKPAVDVTARAAA